MNKENSLKMPDFSNKVLSFARFAHSEKEGNIVDFFYRLKDKCGTKYYKSEGSITSGVAMNADLEAIVPVHIPSYLKLNEVIKEISKEGVSWELSFENDECKYDIHFNDMTKKLYLYYGHNDELPSVVEWKWENFHPKSE